MQRIGGKIWLYRWYYSLKAHIKAIIQPVTVHPRRVLRINIDTALRFFCVKPQIAGMKYMKTIGAIVDIKEWLFTGPASRLKNNHKEQIHHCRVLIRVCCIQIFWYYCIEWWSIVCRKCSPPGNCRCSRRWLEIIWRWLKNHSWLYLPGKIMLTTSQ